MARFLIYMCDSKVNGRTSSGLHTLQKTPCQESFLMRESMMSSLCTGILVKGHSLQDSTIKTNDLDQPCL
jgi:hypothetical protein